MADQIATVSKQRLKSRLATLSPDDIRAVERAIRVQLSLKLFYPCSSVFICGKRARIWILTSEEAYSGECRQSIGAQLKDLSPMQLQTLKSFSLRPAAAGCS